MSHSSHTLERSPLLLISLLKQYGIKRVIASPGTANMPLVIGMQYDPFFEMYSAVDERSAAYMACGMAAESGEPVVITCTEATASRNYMPGLTEAYYRKLPVLAVMTSHGKNLIGSYEPQVIDNTIIPNDIAKYSVEIPFCKSKEDEQTIVTHINEAISQLYSNGGGPVRLLLESIDAWHYDDATLPSTKVIKLYDEVENIPSIPEGNIVIYVGAHKNFSKQETSDIEKFCEVHNGAVMCDLTSNYNGKYRINYSLVAMQEGASSISPTVDLCIYIGTVTGEYYSSLSVCKKAKQFWLLDPEGKYRNRYGSLSAVISVNESKFFKNFAEGEKQEASFYDALTKQYNDLVTKIPEVPFSNLWVALKSQSEVPVNSAIHATINNSFRSWNILNLPTGVEGSTNVGGFGIDGGLSTMIGASLVHKDKLYFCITGDLAFFYDMNSLGNRHVGNNVRVMLINNGRGQEFRNYQHPGSLFGEDADKFVAAGGHFGQQSRELVKHYAEDLGFKYMQANSKEEFLKVYKEFFDDKITDQPMFLEVFTTTEDENDALHAIRNIIPKDINLKSAVKDGVKKLIGYKTSKAISAFKDTLKG